MGLFYGDILKEFNELKHAVIYSVRGEYVLSISEQLEKMRKVIEAA